MMKEKWCAHSTLNSTQWDGPADSLHIRLILAVVHRVQRALIAGDAKLSSHRLRDWSHITRLAHKRIYSFHFRPSYKDHIIASLAHRTS